VGDAVTDIVLGLTSHKVSPESCAPPTRHWLLQHAADENELTSVLGTLGAVQTPLARLTCTTAEGATLLPLAPAATQAPDVVQATLCSGTLMPSDGVPVRWGLTTTFALPHPASNMAVTPTINPPRHDLRAVAVARLMAFPVFSRHVALYRWYSWRLEKSVKTSLNGVTRSRAILKSARGAHGHAQNIEPVGQLLVGDHQWWQ
jgi:hypothetical protein